MTQSPNGFYGLGLAPKLLDRLDQLKYTTPTPIQRKAIPPAAEGKDLVGIAQTGTGKTLAFAAPMLQRLAQAKGRGLVILPTRELAIQVEEVFAKLGQSFGLRTVVLIGGASMDRQIQQIRRNPHVIIATPGRLIDHMESRHFQLNDVRILVLDEADRMLDMGFAPQITKILRAVPTDRQTMLFSATMPGDIVELSAKYMRLPLRIEVAPPGTTAERVSHELFFVDRQQKPQLLEKLLQEYHGTVLVFTRTKHAAKKLTRLVAQAGHSVAEIHSNRSLSQRRAALDGFKRGTYRVLIATDIAARGIDVTGIELVVNFDLPSTAGDYVHRIGRTGRAGMTGRAISFAAPEEQRDVRAIEDLIRTRIPVSHAPGLSFDRTTSQGQQSRRPEHSHPRRPGHFQRRRFGGHRRQG